MSACAIQIERLSDGTFRATTSLLPDFEWIAESEEEARLAAEEALEEDVRQKLDTAPTSARKEEA